MLKDMPYSTLKNNRREYEIMLIRDQYNTTWSGIAKKYNISTSTARAVYYRMKYNQIILYLTHIANVLGKDMAELMALHKEAMKCYWDEKYVCAYIEKKFNDILTEYRDGEPGIPAETIERLPPYKPVLDNETIIRLIDMRENQKLPFIKIAKELGITQNKARHIYHLFCHIN